MKKTVCSTNHQNCIYMQHWFIIIYWLTSITLYFGSLTILRYFLLVLIFFHIWLIVFLFFAGNRQSSVRMLFFLDFLCLGSIAVCFIMLAERKIIKYQFIEQKEDWKISSEIPFQFKTSVLYFVSQI